MPLITRNSLLTLEAYARERSAFRARVMAHKRVRTLSLGEHLTIFFEDELTMRYQIQEMLRIERIFEEAAIQDELNTYNALVPDGNNWKATMMIEYAEISQRVQMLAQLMGIENRVWVRVAGFDPVYATADEDMARQNDTKTSSVHFLRFPLTAPMIQALRGENLLAAGVDHASYGYTLDPVPTALQHSLLADLQ